jgi:ATP-dependent DNA helicase RecG
MPIKQSNLMCHNQNRIMEPEELKKIINQAENSKIQFKERINDSYELSKEFVAFSNSQGGLLIIGVKDKDRSLRGLDYEELQSTNKLIANVASDHVKNPIYVFTETVSIDDQNLILVRVPEGTSKPYLDRKGGIWVKNASDKRRVVSREEISRLLQAARNLHADEIIIPETTLEDLDLVYYENFIEKKFKLRLEDMNISLEQSLKNLSLLKDQHLTLAALLLFSKNRHKYKPLFSIQAISFPAKSFTDTEYLDSEPCFEGTLREIFDQAISFISRNLKKIKVEESFNSLGDWEIPYLVFEEFLVNALIHRDYFINSSIKLFIFSDRIEIISPGKLPNSLSIENIKNGISIPRNPLLQSLAQYLIPYKGLGTGVMRAMASYPEIDLINDTDKEIFQVIIRRPLDS